MAAFYDGSRMRERLPGEKNRYSSFGVVLGFLTIPFLIIAGLCVGRKKGT